MVNKLNSEQKLLKMAITDLFTYKYGDNLNYFPINPKYLLVINIMKKVWCYVNPVSKVSNW